MSEICRGRDSRYCKMAKDQDEIGWRQFMEDMVCYCLREIQSAYSEFDGSDVSQEQWTTGVVIKLSEATHWQWLYHCVQVHDKMKGTLATLWMEELQREIEAQQEQEYDDLLEEDFYLAEVNLEDLDNTSG
jgi:hypothetical protein